MNRVIVVLGHRLEGYAPHPELRARLDCAIRMANRPGYSLVVTGGASNPAIEATEASVMATYLVEQGIQPSRIALEEKAYDTIGNGYFTRQIFEHRSIPRDVDLVTSCYHAERANYVFSYCFGTASRIHTSACADAGSIEAARQEPVRLEQTRRFFQGIRPGDLRAIQARLFTRHALYRSETPSRVHPIDKGVRESNS